MKKAFLLGFIFLLSEAFLFSQIFASETPDKFPQKPIQIIVPYAPGGTTDLAVRALADIAKGALGQAIIVVNKGGGGGIVGMGEVARAKPDGYTIGAMPTGPATIAPHMREMPFDSINDFRYLLQFSDYVSAMVVKSDAPWKTLKEFIEYCRKNPNTSVAMSGAAGQPQHLVMEQVKKQEKVEWAWVPFDGGVKAMIALLGGHAAAAAPGGEFIPAVRSGEARILAILNQERVAEFADAPTLIDLGYNYTVPSLLGFVVPKGTPDSICKKLENVFSAAVGKQQFKDTMAKIQMIIRYRNSKDFLEYTHKLSATNAKILQDLGLSKK